MVRRYVYEALGDMFICTTQPIVNKNTRCVVTTLSQSFIRDRRLSSIVVSIVTGYGPSAQVYFNLYLTDKDPNNQAYHTQVILDYHTVS